MIKSKVMVAAATILIVVSGYSSGQIALPWMDSTLVEHQMRFYKDDGNPCSQFPGLAPLQLFFEIKAETRTTIRFTSADSSKTITVFDNILSRDCRLSITYQSVFWDYDLTSDSCLSIPFPEMESGKYDMEYCTPDTSWSRPFIHFK